MLDVPYAAITTEGPCFGFVGCEDSSDGIQHATTPTLDKVLLVSQL